MPALKDKANEAIARGRNTATRVGKVARSAAVKAAKAGAQAAVVTGSEEMKKVWAETDPAVVRRRRRRKIAAVVAGAAAVTAVGVAISKSKTARSKVTKVFNNGKAGVSTSRLKKVVARARKTVGAH